MNRTTTRALLVCGVIAGPIYVAVGLIEILIRPGFDITRHEIDADVIRQAAKRAIELWPEGGSP